MSNALNGLYGNDRGFVRIIRVYDDDSYEVDYHETQRCIMTREFIEDQFEKLGELSDLILDQVTEGGA